MDLRRRLEANWGDFPLPSRARAFLRLGWEVLRSYRQHGVSRLAAALAYYMLFSLFPLLLLLIAVSGYLLQTGLPLAADASAWATRTVAEAVPQAEPLLREALAMTAYRSREVGLAGLLTLLWSASNVFVQLEAAFRVIWDAQPARSFWKARLVGVLLTLLTVLVLLLTAVGRVALEVVLRSVRALPYGAYLWQWGALGASVALTGLLLAALYRFLPPAEVRASDVWPAAAFGAVAWEALRWGFGWYVSHANYRAIYGPVASVIALLLWVYLASHVLFLGGEIAAARGRPRRRDLQPGQVVV